MSVIESLVSTVPGVDVTDVTSPRAVAVLSVPPHSSVLDIGRGQTSMARALAARGCRVWSIDTDGSAIEPLAPWCEGSLVGAVEQADLARLLGSRRVETILLLSGLEHVSDQAGAIARLVPFLAPGGRIVLSVPDMSSAVESVLRRAGVRAIDEARIGSTETAPLLVVAVPGDVALSEPLPGLTGMMTDHLHRLADRCRVLEERARSLAGQVEEYRCERDRLHEALEEARSWHRRSAAAVSDAKGALHQSEVERHRVEQQLASATTELERCQRERRFLQDDVIVKDAYLATLREQAALHQDEVQRHEALHHLESQRRQQLDDEVRNIGARLEREAAAHVSERSRTDDLAVRNDHLREQLAAAQRELHRVHRAIAETVSQPRYLIADRLNGWLKALTFVHAPLKRAWLARKSK